MLAQLADEVMPHAPFAQMARADVQAFVQAARLSYYAPGETVMQPRDGPASRLLFIRRGAITGTRGAAELTPGGIFYEAGDLFPAAAVAGHRAVTAHYEAVEDTFCLEVDAEFARTLAQRSAPLSDFLVRRTQQLLQLSRQQLQAAQGARALAEHSMEAPLSQRPRTPPVACTAETPLHTGLLLMQQRKVGSVLVVGADDSPLGILTRHDVLERVALPQLSLQTPMAQVMSQPVRTLDIHASAQDAVLTMARFGVRHLPLTEHGRVVSIVSERDLFALQRLSLRQISSRLRAAPDIESLVAGAAEIRHLASQLLSQGLAARALTAMLSHLNDVLTERVVQLQVQAMGLDLHRVCWLAFGSEGRSEQTIATDQDNGLVLADDVDDTERHAWLQCALQINQALDRCGYPLCKGQIMASNPECCLTLAQWLQRFDRWMDQGEPQDLLNASIYFDLRGLSGQQALAQVLRDHITARAATLPRLCKQLADNSLRQRPALNWRGALDTEKDGGREWIDLKLHGTAPVVDAARLLALRHGVPATGTRDRLLAVAARLGLPTAEAESWVAAFDVLQMMRLQRQVQLALPGASFTANPNPNAIDVDELSAIDRRLLKEAMRQVRALQQRIQLDFAA
jgi:CBS domain-containing protein